MTTKSWIPVLPLVIFGWLATLVAIGLVSDDAPALIVLFPSTQFLSNLPPDTSILNLGNWSVTLISQQSGFAKSLFEAGASIVLPSGLSGCFS